VRWGVKERCLQLGESEGEQETIRGVATGTQKSLDLLAGEEFVSHRETKIKNGKRKKKELCSKKR